MEQMLLKSMPDIVLRTVNIRPERWRLTLLTSHLNNVFPDLHSFLLILSRFFTRDIAISENLSNN